MDAIFQEVTNNPDHLGGRSQLSLTSPQTMVVNLQKEMMIYGSY